MATPISWLNIAMRQVVSAFCSSFLAPALASYSCPLRAGSICNIFAIFFLFLQFYNRILSALSVAASFLSLLIRRIGLAHRQEGRQADGQRDNLLARQTANQLASHIRWEVPPQPDCADLSYLGHDTNLVSVSHRRGYLCCCCCCTCCCCCLLLLLLLRLRRFLSFEQFNN